MIGISNVQVHFLIFSNNLPNYNQTYPNNVSVTFLLIVLLNANQKAYTLFLGLFLSNFMMRMNHNVAAAFAFQIKTPLSTYTV